MRHPRRSDAPTLTQRLLEHGWSVMLYDGRCRLCTAGVRFVAARSRGRLLAFSALQSPAARDAVRVCRGDPPTAETVRERNLAAVLTLDGTLQQSDAVLHLLTFMPSPWPQIAWALHCTPAVLRDALFASIDVGRRHLLSRNAECMLEIAEQARRFVR